MKWLIIVIVTVIGLISTLLFLQTKDNKVPIENAVVTQTTSAPTQPVEFTASFLIYTNGTQRVFTDTRYHNLSKDIYLESINPHIVHVKKPGLTWNDFFKTLPMSVTQDCLVTGTQQTFCSNKNETLHFYINGKKTVTILEEKINPYDQLLITYGKKEGDEIKEQLKALQELRGN